MIFKESSYRNIATAGPRFWHIAFGRHTWIISQPQFSDLPKFQHSITIKNSNTYPPKVNPRIMIRSNSGDLSSEGTPSENYVQRNHKKSQDLDSISSHKGGTFTLPRTGNLRTWSVSLRMVSGEQLALLGQDKANGVRFTVRGEESREAGFSEL